MMPPIVFFAEGIPKGQPRARAFSRGGIVRMYDPGTAEEWKGFVALAAAGVKPSSPLAAPLSVDLFFQFPRPKSHYRTGNKIGIVRESAPRFHASKPDADNAAKAILDALTNLGFWLDDAQVCRLRVTKIYAARPGCRVQIEEAQ